MGRSRARRFRFTHLVGVALISEFPTFATDRAMSRAESEMRIHTDPLKVAAMGELRAWRFRRGRIVNIDLNLSPYFKWPL